MTSRPYDEATALRALLRGSPDRVFFLDREGRQQAIADVETDTAELMTSARFDEQRREVMATGRTIRDEATSGEVAFEYTVAPVVSDGEVAGVVVVTRDVTERRRAEAALRESESKFSIAFGRSPLALTITSLADGRLVEVNEGFERMSGYSRAEAVGRSPEDLGLWINPELRAERFTRLRAGLPVPDVEARFRIRNGEVLTGVVGSAVVEINGKPCVLSSVVDITDRKRVEDALQASEARLREFADAAPAMLWITERDGACSFLSRRWYEFTGLTEAAGLGLGWLDSIHPEDRAAAEAMYLEAYANPRPFELDYRLRGADGEYRWVLDSARPRFAPDGEFLGFIGSLIDITDRKRAEQAKDEFLATLSHELRTPLTSAYGWIKLLARGGDAELRETGLHAIEASLVHQIRLIDDLLDVSRISAGRMHIELQPVDLGGVIDSALEMVGPSAEAKQIALHVQAQPPVTVVGDAARLRQVLWNLLANAIKFTPAGGAVDVELRQRDGTAEIVVRDTGEGISKEFLPHVFDRFRQADSSISRAYGGLGIGLSIVASLVEAHHGSVHAQSDGPGRGATFTVTLPLVGRSVRPPLPPRRRRDDAKLAGARVLVVDDDEAARQLMARVLEAAGAEVRECDSAGAAFELFTRWEPHVLVSDLAMPHEDGYSLMRRVREAGSAIPGLAITAYVRPEDEARVREAGFQRHLGKPFDPEELVRAVRDLAS
jgi:PAS domain S-box-containing protein